MLLKLANPAVTSRIDRSVALSVSFRNWPVLNGSIDHKLMRRLFGLDMLTWFL